MAHKPPGEARRSGQAMLLSVLALGGTILGATTIAGLLTLYQIRQAGDLADSAKAVFAADAGIEYGLYEVFKDERREYPKPMFLNGADFSVLIDGTSTVQAVGTAGTSKRAFLLFIQAATATAPL